MNNRRVRRAFREMNHNLRNFRLIVFGLIGLAIGVYYYLQKLNLFQPIFISDAVYLKILPPVAIILSLLCIFAGLGLFSHKMDLEHH